MKAAAILAIVFPLALASHGEQQPYTLSVDVNFVVLNVRVFDKNGESVHGLSKENFDVRETGKRQNISLFIGQDSPATIGLVVDSSASMNTKYADVKAAALRFTESTHSHDQIFVVRFDERLHWPLPKPFTDDIPSLQRALVWNGSGGRTALYDAISAAIKHSAHGESEKRALIVLTDGGDNASSESLKDVLRLAQESNVTIYTIGLFDAFATETNPSVLKKLAALTGGTAFFPRDIEQLAPVWEEIAHGIRTQYTIGYRPTPSAFDGRFHKVRVRVTGPGVSELKVHTRPGYLAREAQRNFENASSK